MSVLERTAALTWIRVCSFLLTVTCIDSEQTDGYACNAPVCLALLRQCALQPCSLEAARGTVASNAAVTSEYGRRKLL